MYDQNTKYLNAIPKNAYQGVVKCGKAWIGSVGMGATILLVVPFLVGLWVKMQKKHVTSMKTMSSSIT